MQQGGSISSNGVETPDIVNEYKPKLSGNTCIDPTF